MAHFLRVSLFHLLDFCTCTLLSPAPLPSFRNFSFFSFLSHCDSYSLLPIHVSPFAYHCAVAFQILVAVLKRPRGHVFHQMKHKFTVAAQRTQTAATGTAVSIRRNSSSRSSRSRSCCTNIGPRKRGNIATSS